MTNVLDYLEESAFKYPDKIALVDDKEKCTFAMFEKRAKEIGTFFAKKGIQTKPVACFMDKSVKTTELFMGIVYAGGFYCLIDPSFPEDRIRNILKVLKPEYIVTKKAAKTEEKKEETTVVGMFGGQGGGYDVNARIEMLKGMKPDAEIIELSEIESDIDEALLASVREKACDVDPLYCNFTSGSTGVPKGVVVNHRSTMDFIEVFSKTFGFTADDVIGNQAPFDFDVSVKDIYTALKMGSTLVIIPKEYFSSPNSVVDMLYDNKVTSLTWAVSALCLVVRLHALKYKVPPCINKVLFSGEMMPIKQLNQWREVYPDAMFVNLYGPTEITCNCTYHILDKEYENGDRLPAGKPFPNERIILLDENDNEVTKPNETGEICVSGTAVAVGYYSNFETTKKVFRQNPLNNRYHERIYCTGDLAYYREDGLLYFAGRKDFQIKHMGHRIELEEVETALNAVSVIDRACCYYDEAKNKIVCCYIGKDDKASIIGEMKEKVPEFMIPNKFHCLESFPVTKNGKIDRKALRDMVSKK